MTTGPARFPKTLALLTGALSATGFAPLHWWPLTLICLVLLLQLTTQVKRGRSAFLTGWLFGVGHFTVGNAWIATAFTYQAKMPGWLGWIAVVLLALYLAVFPGIATLLTWALRKRGRTAPLATALLFAAAWILTEWLRSWVFTGFAWNPLGATMPWAAASSIWIGTYGLGGLVMLAAGGLWLTMQRRWRGAVAVLGGIGILTGAAMLTIDFAGTQAHARRDSDGKGTTITATIVQPNIPQNEKWDVAQRRVNFAKLARLSPPRKDEGPRLLLWPEAAVPDYLEPGYPLYWYDEPPSLARARIASVLAPRDVLLTGAIKLDPTPDGSDVTGARNSVFTIHPDATLGPRYDKSHLVPYGEYLPMRVILEPLGLSRLAPGALDFLAGPGARTLDLRPRGLGLVGVQICYEIIFSGQVIDKAHRPDFLFNPSNDAWFGAWGPPQHLAQARLRAIEEGIPVVRATPTGISAVIDADGRILKSIPQHDAGRIDMVLPPPHAPTLFARFGNLMPLLFAAFLAALALTPLARRRRSR